jgi:hypothetical protein
MSYYYTTVIPRKIPGLSGSTRRIRENVTNSGPLKAIGGQPVFGSASTDANGAAGVGGTSYACETEFGPVTTGGASGGDNDPRCTGDPKEMNNCADLGPDVTTENQPPCSGCLCNMGAAGSTPGPGDGSETGVFN